MRGCAGGDFLAFLDIESAHHAGFKGLDRLDPAAWDNLAGGDGNHIDLAKTGPGQGKAEDCGNGPDDRPSHRRGRRLGDFEGRGQERKLLAAPRLRPQEDDIFTRFHGSPPECDAARRSGRRS